jgi:hypothetical protein
VIQSNLTAEQQQDIVDYLLPLNRDTNELRETLESLDGKPPVVIEDFTNELRLIVVAQMLPAELPQEDQALVVELLKQLWRAAGLHRSCTIELPGYTREQVAVRRRLWRQLADGLLGMDAIECEIQT